MKAHLLASSLALLTTALLPAQDPVACYEFENDDLVASASTSATATDLSISNPFMFGGPGGDRWLCLTTDWNDVGGSISFTVTPAPGNTLDFTRLSWRSVTNAPHLSDSVSSADVYVDGNFVETVAITHDTTHVVDLAGLPGMKSRMAPLAIELVFTGNPGGQSSYEMGFLKVEAAACIADLAQNLTNGGRIIWLNPPGAPVQLFRVMDGVGFSEYADGTAKIVGAVVDVNDPCKRFSLDVTLSDRVDPWDANYPPAGSPKTNPIVDNSGADTDTWRYYETSVGTLTGQLCYEGAVLTITRRGEAFQIGEAANLKDTTYGASNWFDYTVVSQPNDPQCHIPDGGVGDFNFTLGNDCICIGGHPAAVEYYGQASPPGCGPYLESQGLPLSGTEIDIFVGNGGSETRICAVLWSLGQDDLFLPFLGANMLIDLGQYLASSPLSVPPGGASFPCAWQDDACANVLTFYAQAWCIDPCGPEGLSSSRGMCLDIGDI